MRRWRHGIRVEQLSEKSCRYTDEIEAGRMTPAIRLFVTLFYRYRQTRWRGLARVLA